jgi:thiol:disulfide interchange protein DsbC
VAGRSRRSEGRHQRQRVIGVAVAALLSAAAWMARADEATIRRNLPTRLPDLPTIDEVRAAPVPGLWEVRLGHEVIYTDGEARFVLEGDLIDTRSRVNLTEQREEALKAINVATLPYADAVVWRRGNGARKLVVFADPNCSYCRKLEQELSSVTDITVYTFVIPILGDDSVHKARAIWCASDRGGTWRRWMVDGAAPAGNASCDTSALIRNLALQRQHGIVGTPSLVFEDGERVAGVLDAAALARRLAVKPAPRG